MYLKRPGTVKKEGKKMKKRSTQPLVSKYYIYE